MRWPRGRRRVAPSPAPTPVHVTVDPYGAQPLTVTVSGSGGIYIPELVEASPLGLVVVPVGDELEVVVFASVRHRRQEVRP